MSTVSLDVHLTPEQLATALRADVLQGLSESPKCLPPKWFYDARGSELFDEITRLPEYYPTRTERELLRRSVGEIAAVSGADTLVELGSGSSEKTRLLLGAMRDAGHLRRYVPQDVSVSALGGAVEQIGAEFPGVEVLGVVGDFTGTLEALPGGRKRMIAFLGGTLGNFVRSERADFLGEVAKVLAAGEKLLLGVGLVTDPAVLVPAYDDAAGVTAEFNRNVLRVVNRELGGDFAPECFEHVALWDPVNEWIEMRLRARTAMTVTVADLGLTVDFEAGEEMRTEVSAKFRLSGIEDELDEAGFDVVGQWVDEHKRFALVLGERR